MWARMVYATKIVGKENKEQPDWQARMSALKYIDSLDNIDKTNEMKLEVIDKTPQKSIDLNSQDVKDFNQLFKKFVYENS